MNYFFCPAGNYEDFASGRVIYGAKGIPNFPVRLIAEIFGRALKASGKKTGCMFMIHAAEERIR